MLVGDVILVLAFVPGDHGWESGGGVGWVT